MGRQAGPQRTGEQLVVAVPVAGVVECDDEQVVCLKSLEELLRVGASGEGVTQPAVHLLQDGRLVQEVATVVVDGVEHLLNEVVENEAMTTAEIRDERVQRVQVSPRRQAGQLQPGRPSLGARLQCGRLLAAEVHPHHLGEEGGCFRGGEPQVGRPDLDEFAAGAQPGERQRGVGAAGHRNGDSGRKVLDEEGDGPMHLRGIGEMEVVQGDDDRLGVLVEFVDQACDDVLGCRHSLGRAQGSGVPQRATSGVVQRRGQVGEEQAGVLVGRLDRQPGDGRRGCA